MKNNNADNKKIEINDDKILPISLKLDRYFSKDIYRKLLDSITIIFFLIVIIGPVINIFSTIFTNLSSINSTVFNDDLMGNLQWTLIIGGLVNSFSIAIIAVLFDIVIALPMSVILTRYEFKGKKILDTLMDLPMAVPTSALGFSVLLYWSLFGITPGFSLIVLVHIIFTYPYILRNMKIVMEHADTLYEDAARTLGASGFTVFRTVTLPMIKEGLIAGAILAFTRSLGETGATIIVSGLIDTAPIMIVGFRRQLQLPSASFLAGILIIISLILLFSVKSVSRGAGFKHNKVYPKFERSLSNKHLRHARDIATLLVVSIIIIIPSLFVISKLTSDVGSELFGTDMKWVFLYSSFLNSLKIATIAVIFNMIFGLPFALIITRRKWGKFITFLDTILDIPIAIPSAALGFAIFMFWGPAGMSIFNPGFWMIVFVHITFSFPYMVRPIIGVLENSDSGVEEAAKTLGASNITVFKKITFPNIKEGILAGSIMVFTRSLGETGATIVVMGSIRTIPVLIVDWVEANSFSSAIFASVLIIIFSAIMLLLLRYINKRGGKSA